MNYQVIVRPEAEADISDAAAWYEQQRPGLGLRFLAEVNRVIGRILTNPRQYQRLRRKPDVRRGMTRVFPYRVFYVLRPDTIVIFRVLHDSRRDREWKGSIPDAES